MRPKDKCLGKAIDPCSPRPPRAAAVVVLPNHLRCTGLVMNDVGTPFERWQCWVQRWGWVGRGGWHGWVHFCCRQPPDPMVNPFHGPSPRLCTRSGLQPCLQTHPALCLDDRCRWRVDAANPSLRARGWGRGGGGWVAVSLIRAPNDFCLSDTQPPPGPHLDTSHWTAMDPSGPANSGFPGF